MAFRTTLMLSLLLLSVCIFSATSSSPDLINTLVIPTSVRIRASDEIYDDETMSVGSGLEEAVRRGLAGTVRYISYEALKKDRVPCNRRGNSYYNCKRGKQANPYRRGCSIITHCQKIYD